MPAHRKTDGKRVRRRAIVKHRTLKLTKKRLKAPKPLIPPFSLLRSSTKTILANKRLFIGIALIYSLLSFVLIQGLGSTFNLNETKQQLEEVLGGEGSQIGTSFALFGYLVSTFGSQSADTTGTYQMILSLVTALATIWSVRQIASGERPTIKNAYYKSMYPLVPFAIVILAIGLQLLPAVFGNFLYSTVTGHGLAVTALESVVWLCIFLLLGILSLYMVSSSIFALYIVSLPDTGPLQALRSARALVLHRRLSVLARVLLLPIILLIFAAVIFVPLVMFVPAVVEPLFLLFSAFCLVFTNVYMYNLYRSLL